VDGRAVRRRVGVDHQDVRFVHSSFMYCNTVL
jgi:hypothetical protein